MLSNFKIEPVNYSALKSNGLARDTLLTLLTVGSLCMLQITRLKVNPGNNQLSLTRHHIANLKVILLYGLLRSSPWLVVLRHQVLLMVLLNTQQLLGLVGATVSDGAKNLQEESERKMRKYSDDRRLTRHVNKRN